MTNLSVTHRLPRPDTGCCPDCGMQMRPMYSQLPSLGAHISCADISTLERLRIELETAEDRVTEIKRQIARLERQQ